MIGSVSKAVSQSACTRLCLTETTLQSSFATLTACRTPLSTQLVLTATTLQTHHNTISSPLVSPAYLSMIGSVSKAVSQSACTRLCLTETTLQSSFATLTACRTPLSTQLVLTATTLQTRVAHAPPPNWFLLERLSKPCERNIRSRPTIGSVCKAVLRR
jgi:hypothetical protein